MTKAAAMGDIGANVAKRSSVTLLTVFLQRLRPVRPYVKQVVDAKAQFRSLAEPWADTGTSTGRLMIAVLGGLADVERDLIRTRTAEGRSRAKAQGQQMGRPPALTPTQQKEATRRRAEGATLDELARRYNVGISTIRRATRAA
jgi:DNA invertase Pin-like site-specific DNA recombinase